MSRFPRSPSIEPVGRGRHGLFCLLAGIALNLSVVSAPASAQSAIQVPAGTSPEVELRIGDAGGEKSYSLGVDQGVRLEDLADFTVLSLRNVGLGDWVRVLYRVRTRDGKLSDWHHDGARLGAGAEISDVNLALLDPAGDHDLAYRVHYDATGWSPWRRQGQAEARVLGHAVTGLDIRLVSPFSEDAGLTAPLPDDPAASVDAPFPDEADALAVANANPSETTLAHLAEVRFRRGLQLAAYAEERGDSEIALLAVGYLQSAAETHPERAGYWLSYAALLERMGDDGYLAIEKELALRRVLELHPDHREARLMLATQQVRDGRYDDALVHLEAVIDALGGEATPAMLAAATQAWILGGSLERGQHFLAALLARAPGLSAAQVARAMLWHEAGEANEAGRALRGVIEDAAASPNLREYAALLRDAWRGDAR